MTDTYSIEDFRKAVVHQYPDWGGDDTDEFLDNIEKELTKEEWKPEREQVYANEDPLRFNSTNLKSYEGCRPLSQAEVGSGWVPAKDNWAIDVLIRLASYERFSSTDEVFNPLDEIIAMRKLANQALKEHGIEI